MLSIKTLIFIIIMAQIAVFLLRWNTISYFYILFSQ